MNTQQKAIIEELLEGAHGATDLRELCLHLRTATTYAEGLLALETRALERLADLASESSLPDLSAARDVSAGKALPPPPPLTRIAHMIASGKPSAHAPRHDPSGEIVEIPDLETARRYVGQHVLLGHRRGPTAAEDGGICWAPKPGTLSLESERLSTGKCTRTVTDDVVLRVLPPLHAAPCSEGGES